jgi:PTH2 family peptidyl-tRNA hydrolase
MGKGKIAAQCSHAAVGCYRNTVTTGTAQQRQWLSMWELIGEAKIAVKCNKESEMIELEKKATELGLTTCLIVDAGRTQIAPNTRTVLGIGPGNSLIIVCLLFEVLINKHIIGPVSLVNQVTSHLRLL